MKARAACFYATPCGRGLFDPRQLPVDDRSPAAGPCDRESGYPPQCHGQGGDPQSRRGRPIPWSTSTRPRGGIRRARGRVIVLAAGACETVRILLNSKSPRFPQGLANSTGRVGRYIMDTVGAGVGRQIPLLESLPRMNEDGAGGAHLYAPWWLYKEQAAGKLDFPRGYHIEFGADRGPPEAWGMGELAALTGGAYGRRLKEEARRYYGSFMYFSGRGEMIPNEQSFCEIDPSVRDRWGIPVLRFH